MFLRGVNLSSFRAWTLGCLLVAFLTAATALIGCGPAGWRVSATVQYEALPGPPPAKVVP